MTINSWSPDLIKTFQTAKQIRFIIYGYWLLFLSNSLDPQRLCNHLTLMNEYTMSLLFLMELYAEVVQVKHRTCDQFMSCNTPMTALMSRASSRHAFINRGVFVGSVKKYKKVSQRLTNLLRIRKDSWKWFLKNLLPTASNILHWLKLKR